MKYLKIILVFVSISVSGLFSQAQEFNLFNNGPGQELEYLIELNQLASNDQQCAITKQIGHENSIEIIATQQIQTDANIVASIQMGNNNQGALNQNGDNQLIGLIQKGSLNVAKTTVTGNNIFNAIVQIGNNNFVESDINNSIGGDNKTVSSIQLGNENSIELQTAMDFSTVEVIQTGNNNIATLDLTGYGLQTEPYKLEQTGHNAEVTITKSDFYMPMKSNFIAK